MNRSKMTRILAALCAAVLMVGMLAGCAGIEQNSEEAKAQAENRQFMSDVNAIMEELSQRLDSFNDAVSRGDVITMRTQADDAFKVLDNLESLEAPEVLQDVKQGYVDGSKQLKDALNAYIALYTDLAANPSAVSTDAYKERLASIQDTYDQAVEKLKSTDEAATQL
ncbi:MAG: hypothetical protein HFJ73_04905 [Eggerthellaceae bacterium]|jgi:hypothetical protein|nr:hypothetical protein [Eggerthellaceae bacterium]